MTYKEAAEARQEEADRDYNLGNYNAAAVGYLKAAELMDHCGKVYETDAYATAATNMRQRSADATRRRDRSEEMKTRPAKWSGRRAIPVEGDRVRVYINNLGCGTVTGHFTEDGFIGVIVKLEEAPDWYTAQGSDPDACHVFGIEIEPRT